MSARLLPDTSAWNRSNATPELSKRWTDLGASGQIALCPPVRLERLQMSSTGSPRIPSIVEPSSVLTAFNHFLRLEASIADPARSISTWLRLPS